MKKILSIFLLLMLAFTSVQCKSRNYSGTKAVAAESEPNLLEARKFISEAAPDFLVFAKDFIAKNNLKDIVSEEEIAAIRLYTAKWYGSMNWVLRGNDPEQFQYYKDIIDATTSGLKKLDKFTYRGTAYRDADLPEEILKMYAPGHLIIEKAFTSASKIQGAKADGNVKYIIQSKTGRLIETISIIPDEQEVLFPPATSFKVISAKPEGSKTVITMEEVAK